MIRRKTTQKHINHPFDTIKQLGLMRWVLVVLAFVLFPKGLEGPMLLSLGCLAVACGLHWAVAPYMDIWGEYRSITDRKQFVPMRRWLIPCARHEVGRSVYEGVLTKLSQAAHQFLLDQVREGNVVTTEIAVNTFLFEKQFYDAQAVEQSLAESKRALFERK